MAKTTKGSEEDLLIKFFDRVGPVIAIGNPSDAIPIIGAARYYASKQENWKKVVETLIDKASLVILHAGRSEGFLWELETVVRKQPPERILLLISFTKREYYSFRDATAILFPSPLPDYDGASDVPISIKGFVEFDADWTSYFVRMPKRRLHFLSIASGESYLNDMLPEIFRRFNNDARLGTHP
jgi:hypothetical protein